MKLTKEILWDDNFINKFTNLRTSFLIFLTRILIDTKEKYHQLYDASWLTAELKNEFSVTNYYPRVVYKPKFGKPIISYKSKENDIKHSRERIKFEDGIKYIMSKIFFDLKHDSEIELFGIKILNFPSSSKFVISIIKACFFSSPSFFISLATIFVSSSSLILSLPSTSTIFSSISSLEHCI